LSNKNPLCPNEHKDLHDIFLKTSGAKTRLRNVGLISTPLAPSGKINLEKCLGS